MRRIEQDVFTRIGLQSPVLMENAGRMTAEAAMSMLTSGSNRKLLIMAGKGNNGGDGIVCARHLCELGVTCEVVLAEPFERLSADAQMQVQAARHFNIAMNVYAPGAINWAQYAGIVDALLGTGTKGAPRDPYAALIREANASGLPILAVDIPSGIDADTGAVYDPCIRAKRTVTFAFCKTGLAQYPALAMAGEVSVVPIGIPLRLAEQHGVRTLRLDEQTLRLQLHVDPSLPRRSDTHKGTYGHVYIAAGSQRMAGAGLLCARGALRAGSGLVTWMLPAHVAKLVTGQVPEVMLAPADDQGSGAWDEIDSELVVQGAAKRDALVIGPGMGRFRDDVNWMQRIWERTIETETPIVLDADALNMIADAQSFAAWSKRPANAPAILTPHPGEMARLIDCSVQEVQADRIRTAREFSEQTGVYVVLKGAATVVATPQGTVYVNTTGNPGMATGGSGDVLAGMIGSLLAQGWQAQQAAAFGVWWHGHAADRAVQARGKAATLIASDIIEYL